jgi:uncharacterized membrane protein
MSDPHEPTGETPEPPRVEAAPPPPAPLPEPAPIPSEPLAPPPLPPEPVVEAAPPPPLPPPPPPQPAPPPLPEPPPVAPSPGQTIGRRRKEPENPYGKGDFDAVFEGRSAEGLGDRLAPTTCYLLMVISPLGLGVPAIIAAVLAWMAKDRAPEWLRSHYLFMLRTIWIAVFAVLIAILSEVLGDYLPAQGVFMAGTAIWWLVVVVGVAWFVIRATVGMGRLRRGEPIRNYRTWLV